MDGFRGLLASFSGFCQWPSTVYRSRKLTPDNVGRNGVPRPRAVMFAHGRIIRFSPSGSSFRKQMKTRPKRGTSEYTEAQHGMIIFALASRRGGEFPHFTLFPAILQMVQLAFVERTIACEYNGIFCVSKCRLVVCIAGDALPARGGRSTGKRVSLTWFFLSFSSKRSSFTCCKWNFP